MEVTSKNPYTGATVGTYQTLSDQALGEKLKKSKSAFAHWRDVAIEQRCELIRNAGKVLQTNKDEYAKMMVQEMGKPLSEARAEIEKCAWVCDYYADHAAEFLEDKTIATDAEKSFVRHDPLGTIFAIMPWNYPFWQVFRFAAPTLTAGNTALLKHASNVYGCATLIESVFKDAGYPEGVFQNLIIDHDQSEHVIKSDGLEAVSLTGSEGAGAKIAAIAAKELKKAVLELGGNNAFIVCEDADLDKAIDTAITARMMNTGQSCIAAKRFIIVEPQYDAFVDKYLKALQKLKVGDPMEEDTDIGPMAREDLAEDLEKQMQQSIEKGAKLLTGGERDGTRFSPAVLGNVQHGMPAFDEETFGPMAAMIKAKDIDHAFELANQSKYGLGMTVFTEDKEKALEMASRAADGAYFVNELVKSDPRLPFGGTKRSGYGRELSKDGIMEFVNRKTVYVK